MLLIQAHPSDLCPFPPLQPASWDSTSQPPGTSCVRSAPCTATPRAGRPVCAAATAASTGRCRTPPRLPAHVSTPAVLQRAGVTSSTQQTLQAELIMHPCLCACCPRCCSSLSTLRLPLAHEFRPHELRSLTACCLILLLSKHPCPESAPVPGLRPATRQGQTTALPASSPALAPASVPGTCRLLSFAEMCGAIGPWEAVHQHSVAALSLAGVGGSTRLAIW